MPIQSDKGLAGGTTTFDKLHSNLLEITLAMTDVSDPAMKAVLSWYAQNEQTLKKDWPRPDATGSQAQMSFAFGNLSQEAAKAFAEGDMRTVAAIQNAMAWVEEALCCLTMRKYGTDFVGNLTSTLLAELPAKLAELGVE